MIKAKLLELAEILTENLTEILAKNPAEILAEILAGILAKIFGENIADFGLGLALCSLLAKKFAFAC